jgi:hypothetical protein
MSKLQKMLLLVLAVIICGCHLNKKTAAPQTMSNVSVRSSYNPSVKFPSGSKYAFVKLASDIEKGSEAARIDQRIQKALTTELKTKGYKPSEYSDISLFVVYSIQLEQQINILAAKSKVQGNDWITALIVPNDYVTGALLVQIIDVKTLEPIWVGIFNADVTIADVSEKEKQQRVGYAVRELLKTFPPK